MLPIIEFTFVPLAQTDPSVPVESFKVLLVNILLLIGVAVIAYRVYLIAGPRNTMGIILCIIVGFIISMALTLIAYMMGSLPGITSEKATSIYVQPKMQPIQHLQRRYNRKSFSIAT